MADTATQEKPTQLKASEAPRSACQFDASGLMFGTPNQQSEEPKEWTKGEPYEVRLLVRTPEPVGHWYWYGGKVYHDLKGMHMHGDRITMDYGHGVEIGWLAEPEIDKVGLWLTGPIIPTGGVNDIANDVIVRGLAGVPYEASIFFDDPMRIEYLDEGMTAKVNGIKVEGPCTIVRECKLRATAVCSHGRDGATATQFAKNSEEDPIVNFSVMNSQNTPPASDAASMSKDTPQAKDSQKQSGKPANQQSDEASTDESTNDETTDEGTDAGGESADDSATSQNAEGKPAGKLTAKQQFQADLKRFTDKFGVEQGAKFFTEGLSFAEALEQDHTRLSETNAKMAQKLSGLTAVEDEGEGVSETGDFSAGASDGKKRKSAFRMANSKKE